MPYTTSATPAYPSPYPNPTLTLLLPYPCYPAPYPYSYPTPAYPSPYPCYPYSNPTPRHGWTESRSCPRLCGRDRECASEYGRTGEIHPRATGSAHYCEHVHVAGTTKRTRAIAVRGTSGCVVV